MVSKIDIFQGVVWKLVGVVTAVLYSSGSAECAQGCCMRGKWQSTLEVVETSTTSKSGPRSRSRSNYSVKSFIYFCDCKPFHVCMCAAIQSQEVWCRNAALHHFWLEVDWWWLLVVCLSLVLPSCVFCVLTYVTAFMWLLCFSRETVYVSILTETLWKETSCIVTSRPHQSLWDLSLMSLITSTSLTRGDLWETAGLFIVLCKHSAEPLSWGKTDIWT